MKHFALCLCELGSLVDNDVLLLASLTTTHGEAGLPTSTAQRGGLREIGTRGWSLGLRSSDLFLTKSAPRRQNAFVFIRVVFSSRMTLSLALSQAPEHVEGEKQAWPSGLVTHVLDLAKPPSMSRGRVLRHERGEGT
jgi:hypothetical protein